MKNAHTNQPNVLDGKVLLRPRRFAAMADLSPSAVYELIGKGEIPHVRIGRSLRIPLAGVRHFLEPEGQ